MARWIVLLIVGLFVVSLFVAHRRSPPPAVQAAISAAAAARAPTVLASGCAPPAQIAQSDGPLQSEIPDAMAAFNMKEAALKPLAGFSIDARVLSRETYSLGREADFSPLDLALGWGKMRDPAVTERLNIRQSGRWYHYEWSGQPPIPPEDIVRSSANMHMIPSSDAVAEALDGIRAEDQVRIDGWLVQVDAADGWHWRSSLTRDDSGSGACEVIYVCSVAKR